VLRKGSTRLSVGAGEGGVCLTHLCTPDLPQPPAPVSRRGQTCSTGSFPCNEAVTEPAQPALSRTLRPGTGASLGQQLHDILLGYCCVPVPY
jgi:hypothetical protein